MTANRIIIGLLCIYLFSVPPNSSSSSSSNKKKQQQAVVVVVEGFVFPVKSRMIATATKKSRSIMNDNNDNDNNDIDGKFPPENSNNHNNDDNNILLKKRNEMQTMIMRNIFDWLKDSDFIREKHKEHCQGEEAIHMFKGSIFATKSSDALKLQFVNSWAGKVLETIVFEEQKYLGAWKIQKIREAAAARATEPELAVVNTVTENKYHANNSSIHKIVDDQIYGGDANHNNSTSRCRSTEVLIYSFIDCPWCVAAKHLLSSQYPDTSVKVIELESLGWEGKAIRAELATRTGRTSMPSIFIRGEFVGGFTDGQPYPGALGLRNLHEAGRLSPMLA